MRAPLLLIAAFLLGVAGGARAGAVRAVAAFPGASACAADARASRRRRSLRASGARWSIASCSDSQPVPGGRAALPWSSDAERAGVPARRRRGRTRRTVAACSTARDRRLGLALVATRARSSRRAARRVGRLMRAAGWPRRSRQRATCFSCCRRSMRWWPSGRVAAGAPARCRRGIARRSSSSRSAGRAWPAACAPSCAPRRVASTCWRPSPLGASRWRDTDAASAAGVRRLPGGADGAARADVRARRGDVVLRGSGVSRTACRVGDGRWPTPRRSAALTRAPWTLAPGGAIFLVVLVTNLLLDPAARDDLDAASRVG